VQIQLQGSRTLQNKMQISLVGYIYC